jgi:hypothetical protein
VKVGADPLKARLDLVQASIPGGKCSADEHALGA